MDVNLLKGVGEKTSLMLKKLGIETIEDLVKFYPKRYEDWSNQIKLSEAVGKQSSCIKVKILSKLMPVRLGSGKLLFKLAATDGLEKAELLFFNDFYSYKKFEIEKEYVVMGKVTFSFGKYQISSVKVNESCQDLIPIYHQVKGISSKKISSLIKNAFEKINFDNEIFPKKFLEENNLCSINFAIENIHFPSSKDFLSIARNRIIFEEFFLYYLNMKSIKNKAKHSTEIFVKKDFSEEFYKLLPFELTEYQKNSIQECLNDMNSGLSMNRLLQGDVGSGKTAVAAGISYTVSKNGYQVAFMAPTELLAVQHYKTLSDFFKNSDVTVELVHGSLKTKEKNISYENVSSGNKKIIVGTHALISEKLKFKNLGLIITDEQHRFGVNQRGKLTKKGEFPHVLVMSATPIPRTLAMIVYGDLDISILPSTLPGRKKIDTYHIDSSKRERMYGFLNKTISNGNQVYIVCASIEEKDSDDLSVQKCREMLIEYGFKSEEISILHGKMNSSEKDIIMKNFIEGKIKILVATTVIEVGIDVSNATIIVIENAERFGISQLHQLRGRVGRGTEKSYCILVSDSRSKNSLRRFDAMKNSGDGFFLSEEDLKIRGPGDFFGVNQHGTPNIKISTCYEDIHIVKKAQILAQSFSEDLSILEDPEYLSLKNKILETQSNKIQCESIIF